MTARQLEITFLAGRQNASCYFPRLTLTHVIRRRTYLHLCHVDRLVDEDPRGRLVAGRDGDGALVGDVACGVGVKVGYV